MKGRYDRSGQRVPVLKRDAERALASVRRMFRSWIDAGTEEPVLVRNYDPGFGAPAPFAILWEGGPFDWAITATLGGINEEEATLVREFGGEPKRWVPLTLDNVFLEPITGWSLGIYPEDF